MRFALAPLLMVALGAIGPGEGNLGGGTVGAGTIGNGAIDFPASADGCTPPGSPSIWVAARLESSFADQDTVATATNNGSLGGNLTATGTVTYEAGSSAIGGAAAYGFDGSSRLSTSFSAQSYPVIGIAVVRRTGSNINQNTTSFTDNFPSGVAYKGSATARVACYTVYPTVADIYTDTTSSHTHGFYMEGKQTNDDCSAFADGSIATVAYNQSNFGPDLNEFTVGAGSAGASPLTGEIAEVIAYYGTAASDLISAEGSAEAAFASLESCLAGVYGEFPVN